MGNKISLFDCVKTSILRASDKDEQLRSIFEMSNHALTNVRNQQQITQSEHGPENRCLHVLYRPCYVFISDSRTTNTDYVNRAYSSDCKECVAQTQPQTSQPPFSKKHLKKDTKTMHTLAESLNRNVIFNSLKTIRRLEVIDSIFLTLRQMGENIIKQGEEGDYFYIIEEGEVEVIVNSEMVTTITAGGSFGELALFNGNPRAATVRTKTDVKLWCLDKYTYQHTMMDYTICKRRRYTDFVSSVNNFGLKSQAQTGLISRYRYQPMTD